MSFGLCRDCRYWTKEADLPFASSNHCTLAEGYDGRPTTPLTKAWAYDLERYCAKLLTQPDFGCVQFQQKGPA